MATKRRSRPSRRTSRPSRRSGHLAGNPQLDVGEGPGWYMTFYYGRSPRDRNFRVKGYEGPFKTKAEADKVARAAKKRADWLTMVDYLSDDPWTLGKQGHPRFGPAWSEGRRVSLGKRWRPSSRRS